MSEKTNPPPTATKASRKTSTKTSTKTSDKTPPKPSGKKPPPRRLGRGLDALLGAPVPLNPAATALNAPALGNAEVREDSPSGLGTGSHPNDKPASQNTVSPARATGVKEASRSGLRTSPHLDDKPASQNTVSPAGAPAVGDNAPAGGSSALDVDLPTADATGSKPLSATALSNAGVKEASRSGLRTGTHPNDKPTVESTVSPAKAKGVKEDSRSGLPTGSHLDDKPTSQNTINPAGVLRLKVDEIKPAGRAQPRTKFDPEGLLALQESIQNHGVLQPVLVRPRTPQDGDSTTRHRWQLIAGERRWRAAQAAGLAVIPALVRDLDDAEALEVALVENIQRAALTPVEEANAFATLIEDFALSQAEVATRVGKSRAHITNMLRLLTLPPAVRDFVQEGKLGIAHALALLQIEDRALMESAARTAVARGLTVRQLHKVLHRTGAARTRPATQKPPDVWGEDPEASHALREVALQGEHLLRQQLGKGAKVALEPTGADGALKATLHLKDAEQARHFYHVFLRFWNHLPSEDPQQVAETWQTALRRSPSQPVAEDFPARIRHFLRHYVDVLSSHHLEGRPVRSAQEPQATAATNPATKPEQQS